jgi:predicted transcriptional regulator
VADQTRRAAGELEADVLATLWAADGPLTAGQVRERLGSALAYTTVLTILTRLHAKGAVTRALAGRGHAYAPAYDEAELASSRMHAVLDRGSDREAVLARFVGDLSEDDERTLANLLRRTVRRGNP